MFQREIAMIVMRDLADPRLKLSPSITRVKVAEDLGFADVYVTIMGTPGEQSAAFHALQHSAGMIRTKLAQSLDLRQMPVIRFHIDEALKKELEMMEILHKIEVERQEAEAKKAAQEVTESSSEPIEEPTEESTTEPK